MDLAPDLAAAVTERTEGWPVGLYLAALIAKESPAHDGHVAGDDRYVADYLYRVTLEQLPESTQQFLRRTAVLDQLSGPALRRASWRHRMRSAAPELEAANLFLVPLDRRREWYRYHALFREFLLAELHRTEPDITMKLHLRAADWYEANGSPALALEHLLDTDGAGSVSQLMTALVIPTYGAGQISTVQRWLATIGDTSVEAHPPLAVFAAWVAALTGRHRARRSAGRDRRRGVVRPGASDGASSFESTRAMLRAAMCADGVEEMMAAHSRGRPGAGVESLARHRPCAAPARRTCWPAMSIRPPPLFTEASSVAIKTGNNGSIVISESELALLAMDAGRWAEAAEHVGVGARDDRRASAARLRDVRARVRRRSPAALHRGDLDETNRQLARGMRARRVHVRAALARRTAPAAARQGVRRHWPTTRRPATC